MAVKWEGMNYLLIMKEANNIFARDIIQDMGLVNPLVYLRGGSPFSLFAGGFSPKIFESQKCWRSKIAKGMLELSDNLANINFHFSSCPNNCIYSGIYKTRSCMSQYYPINEFWSLRGLLMLGGDMRSHLGTLILSWSV